MQSLFYSKIANQDNEIIKIYESLQKSIGGIPVMFAGGSARKAFMEQDLGRSDIDMFFMTVTDLENAKVALTKAGIGFTKYKNSYTGMVGSQYITEDGVKSDPPSAVMDIKDLIATGTAKQQDQDIKIQLIHKDFYGKVNTLLDSFDFSPAQFAYFDGRLHYTNHAFASVVSGEFVKVPANNNGSIGRAGKMMKNGFTISLDTFYQVFIKDRTSLIQYDEELMAQAGDFYE